MKNLLNNELSLVSGGVDFGVVDLGGIDLPKVVDSRPTPWYQEAYDNYCPNKDTSIALLGGALAIAVAFAAGVAVARD